MRLNNSGFTVVELLAVIVILSIIMSIILPISINIYNKSKINTEMVFIDKLNKLIDDYFTLNDDKFVTDDASVSEFQKCSLNIDNESADCDGEKYKLYKVKFDGKYKIPFKILIDADMIDENDFKNPYDAEKCELSISKDSRGLDSNYIEFFRDEDGVNYFRYRLNCISDNNNPAKEKDSSLNYVNVCNDNDTNCFVYNNVPE